MGDVLAFPARPLPDIDRVERDLAAAELAEAFAHPSRAGVVQDHTWAVDPVDMPWAEVVPIDGVDHVRVMFLLDGDWWCRLFSPAGKPIGHPFRPEHD